MRALVITITLLAPATAKTPLEPGDRCELTRPLRLTPAGSKKPVPLKAGVVVEIVGAAKKTTLVRLDDKNGSVPTAPLLAACKRIEPVQAGEAAAPGGTAPPSPEPPARPEPPPPPPAEATPAPATASPPAAPSSPPPMTASPQPAPTAAAVVAGVERLQDTLGAGPEPAPLRAVSEAKRDDVSGKIKIAVMDLRGSDNVPKQMLASLSTQVSQELDALGPFKAISAQDVQQMLAFENLKDQVGCDDVTCLAEIGGALGADFLVTGSVLQLGDSFLVQLQLMNIRQARADARVSRDFSGSLKGLFEETRIATRMVVRDILAQRSGQVVIQASEEGATVKIDGSIIGVSPVPPLELSGGMHTVTLEKTGFVQFQKDVEVQEKAARAVVANLRPSAEFRRAYRDSARFWRRLSWAGVAVGAAGLGGGGALFYVGAKQAKTLDRDRSTFNAQARRTESERQALLEREQRIAVLDTLALVCGSVGLASAAVGIGLFTTGDDPDRYEAEAPGGPAGEGAGAHLVVLPSGLSLVLAF
ncbi:MAG: PEGA domain-containing protein [Deltaproteobacteria bacterium]|nr:PEGA domain-containing protein [Deltaproteobacteria bacterium]